MIVDDDILVSYLSGNCAPEVAVHLIQWRQAHPDHEKQFQDFKLIWETSGRLNYTGPDDAAASLQRLKQKAIKQRSNPAKSKVRPLQKRTVWLTAAASVLLFAAVSWWFTIGNSRQRVEVITHNQVQTDTLPDGSVLTLNKNTELQFTRRFNGAQRKVALTRGEAFFKVKHQSQRPFIISAGSTTVQVLGTSFNVKNNLGRVEVIVESGMVAVKSGSQAVMLKTGEKAVVHPETQVLSKTANPDQLYQYYRTREFVAVNTPLWRMVEVLNEAYSSRIVLGRKELRTLPLNTTFKNESLDDILSIIARTFNLTVLRKSNQIILR
jgi:ferric-dicitrate binding protein FerR (iron transport regulator)